MPASFWHPLLVHTHLFLPHPHFQSTFLSFLRAWIILQNWFLAQPRDSADAVLEIVSEEEQTNNLRLELLLEEAQHEAVASVHYIPGHAVHGTA